jgi:PAS domain S-box-containing protein
MTIKQSTINRIAILAFLLIALLLGGGVYFIDKTLQAHHQTVERQVELKQLSIKLATTVDYLIEEARQFAMTGNLKYHQNYWQKLEVQTADKVLTRLKALNIPSEEFNLLKSAKQNSDTLIAIEMRSMRLVSEAQNISKSLIHPTIANWTLSPEDMALSPDEKINVAREILFDAQYQASKKSIMEPIAQFQHLMDARLKHEEDLAQQKTHLITEVLIVMVILTLGGIASVLRIFHTQVTLPITQYISQLRGNHSQSLDFALTPTGTQELRILAEAFNQQFRLNQQQLQEDQQQLQENQRIIEDVVQVSQGLSAGHLQIMPQAEYQGDFIQIKQSLENTLIRLRQITDNIVTVSQGLVEGHWHNIQEIEYPGDFVKIQNALSSTAQKLAETTAQNAQQNWLKTGQTELNEKMRGEQELSTLTQNILNYLASYIKAQVGAFFLAEGEYFQLVSSYAYKQRNTNDNQFKLGEGLVGQAALEKKSLLFRQVPKEHLNLLINSGIGESQPNNILVVPLIYEQQVLGVLELATAHSLTAIEMEFLDQVADNIAITLHSAQSRLRMQALLKESQQLTLELQTQQQEIVKSEERIRAIVETIMDAIITTNEQGLIESFNKAAEQIFGYPKSEVIGQNVKILMPEPYHSQHDQYLIDYFNTGHRKLLGKVRELKGQRKDGSVFPIEISLAEMRMGEHYLFTGIIRDITKRKEAEMALQTQREKLLTANEELQVQAEELQVQQEELRQTNEELEEHTQELEQQKEEIRQKNVLLETSQREMEQAHVALETKAKELEQANQYKSEFLANMSHELRTPLNSLLILAQILTNNKAGNLTDKQIEYAKTIHESGTDLLALINDILDLSKVEAGKMELRFEDVFLAELLDTLEHKFRPVAEEKDLTFHITQTDDLPATLYTDTQRLQQILNNLLSNAFKFTSDGEVKLEIKYLIEKSPLPPLLQSEEQHYGNSPLSQRGVGGDFLEPTKIIVFSVTDTGIGIPEEKQKVIFEAFQQADGTTSRRFGGTGLGLSISRQLAHLLGGELSLESQENQGSRFTLWLPEKNSEEQALSRSEQQVETEAFTNVSTDVVPTTLDSTIHTVPAEEKKIGDDRNHLQAGDKSILLIEDDRKFSRLLTEFARERGFKCLIATDGQTGLQLAQQYQPHAIILDVGLPQMDGWTVMEKLKDNPKTRHIPVHFMSASEQDMDAKKMGAIGYLLKPVGMGEINEAFKNIEQYLSKTVKNLLIVVDDKKRQQEIEALIGNEAIQLKVAETRGNARYHLHAGSFDCIIIDVDVEQQSGTQFLEQLQQEEKVSEIPVILYMGRDLTPQEEKRLQTCQAHFTVKAVNSLERLLDEATLFLHQVEAELPKDKQQILQRIHDKTFLLRNKKVLIVDDDIRNTFALMTYLEGEGMEMEVLIGENGKEALALLDEHPDIDIVLMDIMMPEMDGYEAIQAIRNQNRFQKLPIIALTAKAMKGDKTKCIEAGASDYLSKPVDTEKLISLMRVWLYR